MSGNQRQIPIAVVGLGRMGKRHVNNLIHRVSAAKVVAVCTTDANELAWARSFPEYQALGVKVFDDYDTMIQMPGLEAVWVSTSTDVHASQSLAAIAKNLHVLCEKPLSTNLDEVQAVIDAANAKPHLKVMAGFSRRFDASYRDAAQKILKENAIGSPFFVRSQTADQLDTTGFFVRYARKNGGIFVDCAIHDIDLTLWMMSNPIPKSCSAFGTLKHHPELAESNDVDNAVGIVEYWDGKIGYYYCSRTQAHGHDVCTEIIGTDGKIMVNVHPKLNNVVIGDKLGLRNEVQPDYWLRFHDAFITEANEFINAILDDVPVPLQLEDGMKVMQIGRALQDSLNNGGEVVRFDEKGVRIEGKGQQSKL